MGGMRTIVATLPMLAFIAVVASCGGTVATSTPTPEAAEPGYLTQAEYGADWPFTVPAGKLACYDGAAAGGDGRILVTFWVEDRGIEYALNGSALDFGFPDLDTTILPDYPNKVGILDLIERGLTLC